MRSIIRFAALLLIIYGAWTAWTTWKFTEIAEEATATVENLRDSDFGFGERALVRYLDEKRQRRSAVIPFVLTEEPLLEKQQVSILYDPRSTSNVKLNDPLSIWFLPAAAIIFGVLIRTIIRRRQPVRSIQTRRPESAHEIRTSTTYMQLPSRETTANHARETINIPTVRRRR